MQEKTTTIWLHLDPDELALDNEDDIVPSIRTSYGARRDIEVTLRDDAPYGEQHYNVTWTDDKGLKQGHVIRFRRVLLYHTPTHL